MGQDRLKCKACKYYIELNPHHVDKGKVVRSCSCGEVPVIRCSYIKKGEVRNGF